MGETVIVAGIGCRSGAKAAVVLGAIEAAAAAHGLEAATVSRLATSESKASEPGIVGAAKVLGIEVVVLSEVALAAVADRAATTSEASLRATGLPSLSECAALAGAGGKACLLGPRVTFGDATCALSETVR